MPLPFAEARQSGFANLYEVLAVKRGQWLGMMMRFTQESQCLLIGAARGRGIPFGIVGTRQGVRGERKVRGDIERAT